MGVNVRPSINSSAAPTIATEPIVSTGRLSCAQTSVSHSQSTQNAAIIQNATKTIPPK